MREVEWFSFAATFRDDMEGLDWNLNSSAASVRVRGSYVLQLAPIVMLVSGTIGLPAAMLILPDPGRHPFLLRRVVGQAFMSLGAVQV